MCGYIHGNGSELSLIQAVEESAKKAEGELPKGSRVAIAAFESENDNLSDFIMEELIGALVDRGIEVADRQNLEYVRRELDFQMSGEAKDEDAKSVGKFLAADMVITGQLINVGGQYRYRTSAIHVEKASRESVTRLFVRNDAEMKRMIATLTSKSTGIKVTNKNANNQAKTTKYSVSEQGALQSAGKLLDRGILFASRGEYTKAVTDFSKALELNPKMAMAYTLRGRALVADISEAVKVDENFGEVAIVSSEWTTTASDKKIYDQAIADFSLAIKLDPRNVMNYRERGIVYALMRNYDAALVDFDKVIQINPNDAAGLSTRSIVHFEKRNYDKALADCGRVIQLKSQDAIAYNRRGLVYSKIGHDELARSNIDAAVSAFEKALADFTQALSFDPKNSKIEFNKIQARTNLETTKSPKRSKLPTNFNAIMESDQICKRGQRFAYNGDYDQAILNFNHALEIAPSESSVFFVALTDRGFAYINKHNYDKAIEDFDQVIKLNPNHIKARYGQGEAYINKNELDKAIVAFDNVIKRDHTSGGAFMIGSNEDTEWFFRAYANRGVAYYRKGNYKKAVTDFETALRFSPNHAFVLQRLQEARRLRDQ